MIIRSRSFARHLLGCACLVVVMGGGLMAAKPAHALGISPPIVTIPSILHGTTQKRSILLLRAPDDKGDVHMRVEAGGMYASFLIPSATEIVLPQGKDRISYEFSINPANAANGDYEVPLRFFKQAGTNDGTAGNSVRVVSGVTVLVRLHVGGEENLEYTVTNVSVADTEVGQLVPVNVTVNNTGNIDWHPDRMVIDFINIGDGSVVKTVTVPQEDLPVFPAGSFDEHAPLSIEADLPEGEYRAKAAFYYKDRLASIVHAEQSFHVFPEGTLAQNGELVEVRTNKEVYAKDEKIKFDAVFKNSGQVPVKSLMIANISRGGTLLDLVRGKEYRVGVGEEVVMSEVFSFEKSGRYTIETYVEYGNRRTDPKTLSFTVQNQFFQQLNARTIFLVSFLVLILITLFVIFHLKWNDLLLRLAKRARNNQKK